jgi:hypothetical protein
VTDIGRQYPDGPLEAPPGSLWNRLNAAEFPPLAARDLGCHWPIEDPRKCEIHGTDMIYSPARGDYACQDVTCRYGHGGG